MNRRNFIHTSAVTGAAGVLGSQQALGASKKEAAAACPYENTHPYTQRQAFLDYPLPPDNHDAIRKQATAERAKDPRPNILWVFTDQQTFDALSCAGNKHVFTPFTDELAASGTRFETCYCPSPICGPSRGAMVTGRMPWENGVHCNADPLNDDVPTMGEVFRDAGYQTFWSGKWHLPESFVRDRNEMRGFHNVRLPGGLKNQELGAGTDMLFAGDADYLLRYHLNMSPKPWFYTVSLHNPHDICYWAMMDQPDYQYIDNLPELPANHEIPENEPEMINRRRQKARYAQELPMVQDWTEKEWRAYLKAYYSFTEEVDRCVGEILKALEAGGCADNTLVVFTSDHGEGMAAHKWATKLAFYEESARVPMILAYPGKIRQGAVDKTSLTSTLDIFPTICDYAGVKPPANLRGQSLRKPAETGKPLERDAVYMHMATDPKNREEQARMIRTERFKYNLYAVGDRFEELYDLKNDPGEVKNLAHEPDFQDEKAKLREQLISWLESTGDPTAAMLRKRTAY